jgi:HEPN domain-containing protein
MELQMVLNTFATDVFRKQADYDYIAARMNYRMQLRQQFLWSAQQSIEKYLKAILLYNGISARYYIEEGTSKKKEFGHNLVKLNEKVGRIDYLNYELPEWVPLFLDYLTELGGSNRYLSKVSYNNSDAMHKLDEVVWNIRRYCQYIPDSEMPGLKVAVVNGINSPSYKKKPKSFKLFRGELETIINRPHKDPARKALVWANLFYGKKNRSIVKFHPMSSSEIPPQHRDWFEQEANKQIIAEYIKP